MAKNRYDEQKCDGCENRLKAIVGQCNEFCSKIPTGYDSIFMHEDIFEKSMIWSCVAGLAVFIVLMTLFTIYTPELHTDDEALVSCVCAPVIIIYLISFMVMGHIMLWMKRRKKRKSQINN